MTPSPPRPRSALPFSRSPRRWPAARAAAMCLAAAASALFAPAASLHADDETVPPQVQVAVDRGLEWLARNQEPSGAWHTSLGGGGPTAAITSLAAMAFMARGHVPGQGPYGDRINHAVDYVIALQHPDGTLAGSEQGPVMYDHGISTVMLCEAYGMLDDARQQKARTAIAKAVRLILDAQRVPKDREFAGGWRYNSSSPDSDLSVTGWQLMALRGAANIGANVPREAIDAGIAYIKRSAAADRGFSYTPRTRPDAACTGTGILALELLGQHDTREALGAGDFLRTRNLEGENEYYYAVYYCAQAAWQLGGQYWDNIDKNIRGPLLQKQRLDGSWPVSGIEQQGGNAYSTSMAILALSVPYRYLPIYQK